MRRGFAHLAITMDVHTRAIRGWNLSKSLNGSLTMEVLNKALAKHPAPQTHHSDQGMQYAAHKYVARLESHGVAISISTRGRPVENSYAERVIRTIEEEEIHLSDYQTYDEARQSLARYFDDTYMHRRVHSSLGYCTAAESETQWADSQAVCT